MYQRVQKYIMFPHAEFNFHHILKYYETTKIEYLKINKILKHRLNTEAYIIVRSFFSVLKRVFFKLI